jgi:hypothetical protein
MSFQHGLPSDIRVYVIFFFYIFFFGFFAFFLLLLGAEPCEIVR